jgi:hypothetical protein
LDDDRLLGVGSDVIVGRQDEIRRKLSEFEVFCDALLIGGSVVAAAHFYNSKPSISGVNGWGV